MSVFSIFLEPYSHMPERQVGLLLIRLRNCLFKPSLGVLQVTHLIANFHFTALIINALFPLCILCLSLQRYIAFEDSQDGEKKDLQCRLVTLEAQTRQLELKTKNYADQSKSIAFHICHRDRLFCTSPIIGNFTTPHKHKPETM